MSVPLKATQVVLAKRPKGPISQETFTTKAVDIPATLPPGDVLVRVDWISLDPAMRGWLNDTRSYIKPVQIGEKMRASVLGTVIKGGNTVNPGDIVRGTLGTLRLVLTLPRFFLRTHEAGVTMPLRKRRNWKNSCLYL